MGLGLQGAYGVKGFSDKLEEIVAQREKERLIAEQVARQQEQQRIENDQRNRALDIQERGLKMPGLEPTTEVRDVLDESGNTTTQIIDRSGKTLRSFRQATKPDTTPKKYQEVPQGVDVPGQDKPVPAVYDAESGVYRDMSDAHNVIPNARAHREPYQGVPIVVSPGPEGPVIVNKQTGTARPVTMAGTGENVGNKVSPVEAEKVAGIEQSVSIVDKLQKMPKDHIIGPLQGRKWEYERLLPGMNIPQDVADFLADTATLTNSTIKAITGAQMSEAEAKRIKSQIPLVTDQPNTWEAKARATLDNLTLLRERTLQLTGAPNKFVQPSKPKEQKTVTLAELQAIATMKKTTLEQEKARASAAGYIIK